MSAKQHVLNSTDPLSEGADLEAVCGEVVKRAQFIVFMGESCDPTMLETIRHLLCVCSKCRHLDWPEEFVYLAVERQDDDRVPFSTGTEG